MSDCAVYDRKTYPEHDDSLDGPQANTCVRIRYVAGERAAHGRYGEMYTVVTVLSQQSAVRQALLILGEGRER